MQLHPDIEKFYLDILKYAGLQFKDNIIQHENDKLGDITIDGKHLTLPYLDNLKNPDNKLIFHPLNESYNHPETVSFNMFSRRLVLELNLKLSHLMTSLLAIASDVQIQKRIKSSALIDLIGNIGETDASFTDSFLSLVKASKKVNGEGFLFNLFLKKNGTINDTPYAAIGKVNFVAFTEITKALEDKELEYKVFGTKLRKKDLLVFSNLFRTIFPDIENKESYIDSTDNKVFRYLNMLLKVSYIISSQINTIADLLLEVNEPVLEIENCKSDLAWIESLEKMYGLTADIRLIPNQMDISQEAKHLKLDESRVNKVVPDQPVVQQQVQPVITAPTFTPQQTQVQTQIQQPTQPQVLSAEDIIRGNIQHPALGVQQQTFQQPTQLQEPMVMLPNGSNVPVSQVLNMMQSGIITGQQCYQILAASNINPNLYMSNAMVQVQQQPFVPGWAQREMNAGMPIAGNVGMVGFGNQLTPEQMLGRGINPNFANNPFNQMQTGFNQPVGNLQLNPMFS